MGEARCRWMRGVMVAVALGIHLSATVEAETLEVPGDYDTIQEAIDEADDGDTVLVEPGDYVENLDFLGKSITVVSTDGPLDTVIDGSDETLGENSASVVTFASDEDEDARLEGFTLTGGAGTLLSVPGGIPARLGGGIFCLEASPTLVDNIIIDNEANGIHIQGGSPVLEHLVVESNLGSGIRAAGEFALTISDCTVEANENDFFGGGISLFKAFDGCEADTTVIERCTIVHNSGGIIGGGILSNVPLEVIDCLIADNDASLGGGAQLNCTATFIGCEIRGNSAARGAGFLGPSSGAVTLERCMIVDNAASSEGGAFMAGLSTPVSENETTMIHCTIVGNTAPDGGAISLGVVNNSGHSVSLDSCIVWDNGEDALAEGASDGEITAIYSDIDGGSIDGDGNIDEDPMFVDRFLGDYHLDPESPCIDTGNPDHPFDEDDSQADMGALPFSALIIEFKRGDANSDGNVTGIPDGLFLLRWAFQAGDAPACRAAADADGNGLVNGLTDGLYLFKWAFQGGNAPPDPGPDDCGPIDEDEDATCDEPPPCE